MFLSASSKNQYKKIQRLKADSYSTLNGKKKSHSEQRNEMKFIITPA